MFVIVCFVAVMLFNTLCYCYIMWKYSSTLQIMRNSVEHCALLLEEIYYKQGGYNRNGI